MAMAHSVGKPFHLISDTETIEACTRPSDRGGEGLYTLPPLPARGGWMQRGVYVKAMALSVHKEV